jgi:hypothetical protein
VGPKRPRVVSSVGVTIAVVVIRCSANAIQHRDLLSLGLLADAAGETPEPRCQVGVAGACGAPGTLDEDVTRNHRSPLVVAPERFLPPVTLLPGHIPAHEAPGARGWGNRDMSTPISAVITSAARFPTPGMVTSRSRARAKGVNFGSYRPPTHISANFQHLAEIRCSISACCRRLSRCGGI